MSAGIGAVRDRAALDRLAEMFGWPEWRLDDSGFSFLEAVAEVVRSVRPERPISSVIWGLDRVRVGDQVRRLGQGRGSARWARVVEVLGFEHEGDLAEFGLVVVVEGGRSPVTWWSQPFEPIEVGARPS